MFISVTYKMHLQIDKETIKNFKKWENISSTSFIEEKKLKYKRFIIKYVYV